MPLDVAAIAAARPTNTLHYLPSLDSTMSEASRLVAEGALHGTVVIADEQAAGIGRLGRAWHSESEAGIYVSILLRLPVTASSLPSVTLLLGLAAREAIQQVTGIVCDLRWPNDLLLRERKVAGILAQFVSGCVVAGIGINVNQISFPDDLRTPATSLLLECGGSTQNREALVVALLAALDSFEELLKQRGPRAILDAFSAASSYASNRRVVLEDTGEHGLTAGLDEIGFLLIRLDSGRLERLVAGGIRPEQARR